MCNDVVTIDDNELETVREAAALLLLHPSQIHFRTNEVQKKMFAYVRTYLATVRDPAEKIAYQQYLKKQISTEEEEILLWKFVKGYMLFCETMEENKATVNDIVMAHFIEMSISEVRDLPVMTKFGDETVDIQTMKMLLTNRPIYEVFENKIIIKNMMIALQYDI